MASKSKIWCLLQMFFKIDLIHFGIVLCDSASVNALYIFVFSRRVSSSLLFLFSPHLSTHHAIHTPHISLVSYTSALCGPGYKVPFFNFSHGHPVTSRDRTTANSFHHHHLSLPLPRFLRRRFEEDNYIGGWKAGETFI